MLTIKSVTIDDPVKEQILADSVKLYNDKQRMVDPNHVDITPEEQVLDYINRYIEGLAGPVLSQKEVHERLTEEARVANLARKNKSLINAGS